MPSEAEGRVEVRKVRTPQSSVLDNVQSEQSEGKWHRKYTAYPIPKG